MDTFYEWSIGTKTDVRWITHLPSQNNSVQSPSFYIGYGKFQLEITRRDIGDDKEWLDILLLKQYKKIKVTDYFVDIYVIENTEKLTCISHWIVNLDISDDYISITNPCRYSISKDDSKSLPKERVKFFIVFKEVEGGKSEKKKCGYPAGTLNRPFRILPTKTSPEAGNGTKINTPPTVYSKSTLKGIFLEPPKYDVVLKCGHRRISAHRDVLSEKSEKFKNTFQLSSLADIMAEVYVTDIDTNVLQYLLRHIYSGEISDPSTLGFAIDLYKAAEKYILQDLKWKCASRICTLTDKTICDTLLMANERGYPEVFESAASHIASKMGFLMSKEWQDFCADYPLLARMALPKIQNELKYSRNYRK